MTYDKKDSREALKLAAEELGKSPTFSEYQELGISPSAVTIAYHIYNSWNEAKKDVELETYQDSKGSVSWYLNSHTNRELVSHSMGKQSNQVLIHRLIAVANHGFDSVKDNHIHHKNGIPLDNRPENLKIMSESEHRSHHMEKMWKEETGVAANQ